MTASELDALQWNWGDAYDISTADDGGHWTAKRQDGKGSVIEAKTAEGLGYLIRQDYSALPVPRGKP